jgi:N-acetylneuraminate lyase
MSIRAADQIPPGWTPILETITMALFQGLIAAPFTPMHEDGSLHLGMIPRYYAFLKHNGVHGAFICGSTGEGVSLSLDEKKRVIDAWGACASDDDDFAVMPLVGGTSLEDCRNLARHAEAAGMDAVSFTAPFYFKPADARALADCCIEVGAAVPDMPFYYYHIPVLTGVGTSMIDLLQAIDGRMPSFVGIKYTHEDFMDYLSCIHFAEGRYNMLWGRDENMLPALSLGAPGAVGSTYNYAAPLYLDLMAAFASGDLASARSLQQQSIDMIRLLGKYGGIATGKAFMRMLGMDCGKFRLPVRNMTDDKYELFVRDVKNVGFESFCSSPLPAMQTEGV